MKYWLTLLLVIALSVFAAEADLRPFVFEEISSEHEVQQAEFDYMLKYKLFGRDYLKMGRRVVIPDKSGWNGSKNDITSAEGLSIGGPTLAGGSISVGDGCKLTTGPVHASSMSAGNDNGEHFFAGTICLNNTAVSSVVQTGINRAKGTLTNTCPEVPNAPTGLSLPTIKWPSTGYQNDIIVDENFGVAYIDVPDGTDQYDLYFNKIHLNRESASASGKEGATLYIRMQDGGRLTRIFVHDLQIGNHTSIRVVYRTADGDYVLPQDAYRGNVLIYSDNDISFVNTDNTPIQGSFLSTAEISLKCNLDFSGQLIANKLYIGDDFNGEHFHFVIYNPDTLDIDPTLNKNGGLRENDSTVIIPIQLSDTATVDVFFNYCFDLKDGVTVDDFNLVTSFPICGTDEPKTVSIPTGKKVPTEPIKINVKKDTLTEPNDYLVMKIAIESGAVLPNSKTTGELSIKIIDAVLPLGFDTTAVYTEKEHYTGIVDNIKIVNYSDKVKFVLDSAYTGRYSLDEDTGVLTLRTPVDYETTPVDTIKVTVKDTGDISITGYIPISVIDINENPVLNDTTLVFNENSPVPTIIGTLKATDGDTDPRFTKNEYSIVSGSKNFTIDAKTGRITTSKMFDFETDTTEFVLKVLVADATQPTVLYDTAFVTVKVNDVNEIPVVENKTFSIPENVIDTVGKVDGFDPEGNKLTYVITNDVPFKIDSNGVITNTKPFDYEAKHDYVINVDVSDGAYIIPIDVKVIVNDVDEPVHAHDTTLTVDERQTGPIGKVTGEDEDGKPVKFTGSDSVHYHIHPTDGVVEVVKPFDYETTKADTLLVFVEDVNGNIDTATVVVKVNNVNDPPKLQPNDSLSVPENCKNCTVGTVTAIDPDHDPITYKVIDPRFTIDSTGKLTIADPVDYETTPTIKVTVVASDTAGASDTLVYKVKIDNVNEPVHTKDTTCSVAENTTGKTGCKIDGWDEDKTKPTFIVTDTTRFGIDSTGEIIVKKPYDYETKTTDTVKVIVTDGEFSDTSTVAIKVVDVPEKATILEVDHEPKKDTIKTNKPDHIIDYKVCEGIKCAYDSIPVTTHKDTTVKACNAKKTSCDQVVILFNDAPPVVILDNAKNTTALIDYITIEEQKSDDRIYVNKKDNKFTVTVKDTVHKTEQHFTIDVKTDTVAVKQSHVKDYSYIVDEKNAKVTPIGDGKAEVSEVIKVDGINVTITKVVDAKTMEPVDSTQTVSYTTTENGKEVTISYTTDNLTGERLSNYHVSYKSDSCTTVSYDLDDSKKIIKNKEGNFGFTIKYEYTDEYGNKASSEVAIVYDDIPPKVEILSPEHYEHFHTNAIKVKWTVNGEVQDTLNLQRLDKGINDVIRRYVDKAGNVSADTVTVFMKEAKDIEITIINPVNKIDQEKVDEYYKDNKYSPKKPYSVQTVAPSADKLPETIGVGFKIDVVLPSVSATGGLATLDDIVKNGQIPVDDKGNIVGASTIGIPVDEYVEEHCTEEFQKDYKKNGLNIPLYDVTYNLHLWVYTTQANYVNDFRVEYTLNDQTHVTDAGTVQMVLDWLADKDGNVKAKNGHALGTGAYITQLESKSIAKHRCDYKTQKKGDKTVKKEDDMTTFGYKRPTK